MKIMQLLIACYVYIVYIYNKLKQSIMKTLTLLLIFTVSIIRLEAKQLNDFKVGLTYVPNRSGLGMSIRLDKNYLNFEYGNYGGVLSVEKYSIQRIFSTIDARHLFVGMSYTNAHEIGWQVEERVPSKIGLDFGFGIDTMKKLEIIAATGVCISDERLRFEIKVGILFSFKQSYNK